MKKRRRFAGKDFLEPLTSKVKNKRFLVFDLESKHDDTQAAGFTRPFAVGMFDHVRNRYREFRDEKHLRERPWYERHLLPGGCIDKFMNAFLRPRYVGWVAYAHNMGSFDGLFLLAWLENHRDEYVFEVVPVQSSIQVIRIWTLPTEPEADLGEGWEIHDSLKLLPMSLEKAAKAMGVVGKLSHDLEMHEDDPRWSDYLEQDCRALSAVMVRFYSLVARLGGEVGLTTPSTSIKLFRRRFLGKDGVQEKIPRYRHFPGCSASGKKPAAASSSRLPASSESKPGAGSREPGASGGDASSGSACEACLHQWIRLGYYGGRTEIHHFEGRNLRYFDFNSSYAASMNEDMPIGDLIVEEGKLDMRRHTSQGGRYAGFCECEVEIPPECPIPPLPYRHEETGKLVFPAGVFHGVWSVDELALLSDPLVNGKIRKIVKTVWYGLRPMFQGMVKALYRLRDKRLPDFDEGLSLVAKLLLNGGYGKFAMKTERSTVVFSFKRVEKPADAREVTRMQCFLCKTYLPTNENGEPVGGVCASCEGSKPASPEAEGSVWYKMQRTDASYIIPQISAHVTATARVRLWRVMREVLTKDAGERASARTMRFGDVVLLEGTPRIVVDVKRCGKRIELLLTGGLEGEVARVVVRADARLVCAGRIFYLDTDSVITNVDLASSEELGALKDEHPGDTISYVGVQAKVYMIAKEKEIERAAALDRLDVGAVFRDATSEEPGKVTMKGFPPRMRTPFFFARLRKGDTALWERLEKVRSLARTGFARSPRMEMVTKSIQGDYDKRIRVGNGTRALVLDEPIDRLGQAAE